MSVRPEDDWIPLPGKPGKVYQAINKVQAALAKEGITKSRKNAAQGYNFRGIDEVYNAISPLLAEHGLCILPRMMSREVVERESAKGGALFYVTVAAEFDFVCAEDGSSHTVRTYGEAMDSGDKATNKAMSAAYKYAAMQAFAIPTEGDNDADATTHEIKAKRFPTPVQSADREELPAAVERELDKLAASLIDLVNGDADATAIWKLIGPLGNEEKLYLWAVPLKEHASVRSRVKAVSDQMRSKVAA